MKTKHGKSSGGPAARRVILPLAVALALGCLAKAPAARGAEPAPDKQQSGQAGAPSETAPKNEQDGELAIVGGDLYTITRGIVRQGVVLVRQGKIARVGQDIKPPDGARVIDARGKYVTPGFIAIDMSRVALNSASDSSAKLADLLDPFDPDIKRALGAGITAGCVELSSSGFRFSRRQPGEAEVELGELRPLAGADSDNPDFGQPVMVCPCCGLPYEPDEPISPAPSSSQTPRRSAVLKMSYGALEPMLLKESPFYDLGAGALTGSLNRFNWRRSVESAKKYAADLAEHERQVRQGKKPTPPKKTVKDDLLRLVNKQVYLRIRADTADEIRDMIALSQELDYKLLLEGAAEGWLVAEELSRAGAPVTITPRRRRAPLPSREDSSGSSIEASGIFQRAGVAFALAPLSGSISLGGIAGRDLTSLPLEAAFAVRGGCSEQTALAALTFVPAQLLGVADRLGSIEEGKDADLLILDGPPLDYRTYVETALVSGLVCYQRDRDRVYPVFDRSALAPAAP